MVDRFSQEPWRSVQFLRTSLDPVPQKFLLNKLGGNWPRITRITQISIREIRAIRG